MMMEIVYRARRLRLLAYALFVLLLLIILMVNGWIFPDWFFGFG
jgi:hypothetical protein